MKEDNYPLTKVDNCPHLRRMAHSTLLSDLDDYCSAVGLKITTVCNRALGNTRFPQVHQRRLERLAEDERRIRKYMADNPPEGASGVAHE